MVTRKIDVSIDLLNNTVSNFAIECRATAPENPVKGNMFYNESNGFVQYYDGTRWTDVCELDENSKIPTSFLYCLKSTDGMEGASDDSLVSSLLMKDELDTKLDDSQLVTSWSQDASDDAIPSEKLTKDTLDANYTALDTKIDETKAEIIEEIEEDYTALDTKIDTVRTELDTKIDDNYNTLDTKIGTTRTELESVIESNYTTLDTKIDTTKSDLLSRIDSDYTALDTKIDTTKSDLEQEISDTADTINQRIDDIKDEIEVDVENKVDKSQIATAWDSEVSDDRIPSEKLTKDTIDANYNTLDAKIDSEYTALDTKINDNYSTLDTKINDDFSTLDTRISDNYTTLDTKIDTTKSDLEQTISDDVDTLNSRIDNIVIEVEVDVQNKVDKSQIVTEWSDEPSDTSIPSEKLTKDAIDTVNSRIDGIDSDVDTKISDLRTELTEDIADLSTSVDTRLDGKLDDSQLVTSWSDPVTDEHIPSEKLTKDTLDAKVDDSQIITSWNAEPSDSAIPSESLVKRELDAKLDDSQLTQYITGEQSDIPSGYAVQTALDTKTDKTMAIPLWNHTTIYHTDSTVIQSGILYISLVDSNVNRDPLEDVANEYWTKIQGGGGGGSSIVGRTLQFGNSNDTVYQIEHNLSTYDFLYTIRTTDYPREYVQARVQATSKNECTVLLTNPPGDNALTFNIVPVRSTAPPTSNILVVDISEPTDEWRWNDNETGHVVFVQTYDESGDQIQGAIAQPSTTDFNPVVTDFGTSVSGSMFIAYSDLYQLFENKTSWMITHNLGTYVAIQMYNDQQGQIFGEVIQDGNSVIVTFPEPTTGYMTIIPPTIVAEQSGTTWAVEHGLDRIVGVQTYDSNNNQIQGNIQQTNGRVEVTFATSQTGTILII
jgi:hypothetical protein